VEVTDPPVTENFPLNGPVPTMMESIFEATLNIVESMKLSFRRVDHLGLSVSEGAHKQSQAGGLSGNEVVLDIRNGETNLAKHFIPGFQGRIPQKSIRHAEEALRKFAQNLHDRDPELTLESQFISPTKNNDGRMVTGLLLTWKVSWNSSAIKGIKGIVYTMKMTSRLLVIPTAHAIGVNAGPDIERQSSAETFATDPSLRSKRPDSAANSSDTATPDGRTSAGRTLKTEEPADPVDFLSIPSAESGDSKEYDMKMKPEV
jgi:hypothetical protein